MRRIPRAVLALMLLGVGVPSAIVAASAMAHIPADPACSAHLASPDQQGAYSSDYFSPAFDWAPRTPTPVTIHLAAYAPTGDTQAPTISDETVLYGERLAAPPNGDGGAWSVDPRPAQVVRGRAATLYCYVATWTVPSAMGAYYLTLVFHFQNGTILSYYVNETVSAAPQALRGLWHWQTTLTGMGAQNPANNGYDLLDAHIARNTITAQTTFYFDGNPAATPLSVGSTRSTSYITGGMVNQREQGHNGVFHIPPRWVYVPYLAPGHLHADNGADPVPYSADQGGPPQSVGVAVDVCDGGAVVCTVGGHVYRYRLAVTEPVVLRVGNPAMSFISAGSYVVDNAFTGHVVFTDPATGRTTDYGDGVNLGEGQGFIFYANPGAPRGDGDPHNPHAVSVSWSPVDPSTYDSDTALTYNLAVCPAAVLDGCQQVTGLRAPSYGLSLASGPYGGAVQAIFTIGGPSGPYAIASAVQDGTWTVSDVPAPRPTSTSGTPDMLTPAPTSTPTPVPPTATPVAAHALLVLQQTVVPYAWIRLNTAEDPASTDQLIPTTSLPNPAHVFWPVGKPLHILPAAGEHAQNTSLVLQDLGNGAAAKASPAQITSTTYAVQDLGSSSVTSCGPPPDPAPIAYQHDGAAYPQEVSPFSGRVVLVWAPTIVAGHVQPTTRRCDVAPLLPAGASSTLVLSYRVRQRITVDLQFGVPGAPDTCDASLVPVAPGRPRSPDPAVPAPPPAFATPGAAPSRPCPAGRVRRAAVLDALAHPATQIGLADTSGNAVISGVAWQVDPRRLGNQSEVGITLDVERTLQLRYTLTFRRSVS